MLKGLYNNFTFRLVLLLASTAGLAVCGLKGWWEFCLLLAPCWWFAWRIIHSLYQRNAQKIAFLFDAIDNNDYAFKYSTRRYTPDDTLVSDALNRITQILFRAKQEAIQKEKYYELILNSVNTGILVVDDNGYIYQTNNEALRLLGLTVLTHLKQLTRIDEGLEHILTLTHPGEKQQVSFSNERGEVHLSIRASEMMLAEKHVRILALNDIRSELDDKEIDSWIRLTRVLTHEIMNSVTPVTSLSDTLLSLHGDTNAELRNGLEVISSTGKSLIAFVESYRKFTHIPTPQPSLFYLDRFAQRIVQLARHHNHFPNITVTVEVEPSDLIVHADENLISQVMLNLLKNAMQAIGTEQADGHILLKAYSNSDEAVLVEVSNNGPAIPPDEMEHIFVPFFTTKEGGSGIGLSISRQIMRLSGGSLTLKSVPTSKMTTFVLTFP